MGWRCGSQHCLLIVATYPEGCLLVQVEFHRYLLQLRLARCPKGKGWLGRKLWKAKTFLSFCAGNTC